MYRSKRKPTRRAGRPEAILQQQVCSYIKARYPNIVFHSDSSGMRVTMFQARYLATTRSDHAHLDIFIAAKRGGYSGLYIELKAENNSPFKKDGSLKKNDHIHSQHSTMLTLMKEDYFCSFAVGYEQAVTIIENYMSIGKKN